MAKSPQQLSEPLLVPLKEAARLLGCHLYSVRVMVRSGELPYKSIGNRVVKKFVEASARREAA